MFVALVACLAGSTVAEERGYVRVQVSSASSRAASRRMLWHRFEYSASVEPFAPAVTLVHLVLYDRLLEESSFWN